MGSVRVFAMEFLYSFLNMFQLRCLFPFAFLMVVSVPMYEVFEFSTVLPGIHDFLDFMFFLLFDDGRRGWFGLFLGRESAFVIWCQQ